MKHILCIIIWSIPLFSFCQNATETSILTASDSWGKEIIVFPIDWAPNLNLTGFEELRFAPGWADRENDQFWSLVMAWKVDAESMFTTDILEKNIEAYFDGLMKPNHWAVDFPDPVAVLIDSDTLNEQATITGKLNVFDGFFTAKPIILNMAIEQYYCATTQKNIVVIRFSPQNFEHSIWNDLKEVKLVQNVCE